MITDRIISHSIIHNLQTVNGIIFNSLSFPHLHANKIQKSVCFRIGRHLVAVGFGIVHLAQFQLNFHMTPGWGEGEIFCWHGDDLTSAVKSIAAFHIPTAKAAAAVGEGAFIRQGHILAWHGGNFLRRIAGCLALFKGDGVFLAINLDSREREVLLRLFFIKEAAVIRACLSRCCKHNFFLIDIGVQRQREHKIASEIGTELVKGDGDALPVLGDFRFYF